MIEAWTVQLYSNAEMKSPFAKELQNLNQDASSSLFSSFYLSFFPQSLICHLVSYISRILFANMPNRQTTRAI